MKNESQHDAVTTSSIPTGIAETVSQSQMNRGAAELLELRTVRQMDVVAKVVRLRSELSRVRLLATVVDQAGLGTRMVNMFFSWAKSAAVFVLMIMISALELVAADETKVVFRTGAEFRQQLETPVGLDWTAVPLREKLHNLSRSQHIAIWLDRRVDPDQRVTFSSSPVPLDELLQRLTHQLDLGLCYVGPVAYIGPKTLTAKLATVAALRRNEVSSLPIEKRRALVAAQSDAWDDLAEPRLLIAAWLEKSSVQISPENLQKIPHDLWGANQLPALGLADRLSLALAGFGVTFEISGSPLEIRFAVIPERVVLEQTYAPRGDATRLAADLAKKFPNAEVRRDGAKLRVAGSYEDHELIDRLLRGERVQRTQVTDGDVRYTLKVERQPFAAVVRSLGEKLMLEVEFDPAVENIAAMSITFEVKDATLEQLMTALTRAAGAGFTLNGKKLKIRLQ